MKRRNCTHDFDRQDSHTLFTPRGSINVRYRRAFKTIYIELRGAIDLS